MAARAGLFGAVFLLSPRAHFRIQFPPGGGSAARAKSRRADAGIHAVSGGAFYAADFARRNPRGVSFCAVRVSRQRLAPRADRRPLYAADGGRCRGVQRAAGTSRLGQCCLDEMAASSLAADSVFAYAGRDFAGACVLQHGDCHPHCGERVESFGYAFGRLRADAGRAASGGVFPRHAAAAASRDFCRVAAGVSLRFHEFRRHLAARRTRVFHAGGRHLYSGDALSQPSRRRAAFGRATALHAEFFSAVYPRVDPRVGAACAAKRAAHCAPRVASLGARVCRGDGGVSLRAFRAASRRAAASLGDGDESRARRRGRADGAVLRRALRQ